MDMSDPESAFSLGVSMLLDELEVDLGISPTQSPVKIENKIGIVNSNWLPPCVESEDTHDLELWDSCASRQLAELWEDVGGCLASLRKNEDEDFVREERLLKELIATDAPGKTGPLRPRQRARPACEEEASRSSFASSLFSPPPKGIAERPRGILRGDGPLCLPVSDKLVVEGIGFGTNGVVGAAGNGAALASQGLRDDSDEDDSRPRFVRFEDPSFCVTRNMSGLSVAGTLDRSGLIGVPARSSRRGGGPRDWV